MTSNSVIFLKESHFMSIYNVKRRALFLGEADATTVPVLFFFFRFRFYRESTTL
jgi:hypothetical protein